MSDELADNLRKYRRAARLSQEQLAHRASMSVGPIRKIEQGHGGVRMETLRSRSSMTIRTVRTCASCVSHSRLHSPSGRPLPRQAKNRTCAACAA
ncbi:helix-turn-helix transcriptional regulator [Streptomyces drozdowiczii]